MSHFPRPALLLEDFSWDFCPPLIIQPYSSSSPDEPTNEVEHADEGEKAFNSLGDFHDVEPTLLNDRQKKKVSKKMIRKRSTPLAARNRFRCWMIPAKNPLMMMTANRRMMTRGTKDSPNSVVSPQNFRISYVIREEPSSQRSSIPTPYRSRPGPTCTKCWGTSGHGSSVLGPCAASKTCPYPTRKQPNLTNQNRSRSSCPNSGLNPTWRSQ